MLFVQISIVPVSSPILRIKNILNDVIYCIYDLRKNISIFHIEPNLYLTYTELNKLDLSGPKDQSLIH